MPYVLPDTRRVSPEQAFELGGVQYPRNWLKKSTAEDRAALNITWEADPPAPEPPPPTREQMQKRVDIERDRRLEKFTFANVIYDFDETSRNRIDKARGSALAAIIAGAEANDLRWADANNDFGWIAADNSFNTMDAPTTLAFGNAAAAWEGLHIVAARNLKNLDPIPEGYANDQYWPSA